MMLSIKKSRYAFLIKLGLMFSISLWKEFQLLQTLNDLSIKHVIKLILYENDAKAWKFKKSPVKVDLWYVWSARIWLLIPEMNTSRNTMEWLICFSIINVMLECILFKKSNKFNKFCSLSKATRMSSIYLQ